MQNRVITHRKRKVMGRYEKQREDHANGGYTIRTVRIGEDMVEFALTIDLDNLIERLSGKAWRNASKRSKAMWGTVDVKARKV